MVKEQKKSELTDVNGVGPARAKKLRTAGVKTPAQLARLQPETVAKKAGISKERAKKLVSSAKKLVREATSEVSKQQAARSAERALEDITARARDHFKQAPNEQVFVLCTGEQLRDLRELAQALEGMREEVFRHHVNEDKHDFAAWIQHVLDEHALADELRESRKHPEKHGHAIYRHITRRVW